MPWKNNPHTLSLCRPIFVPNLAPHAQQLPCINYGKFRQFQALMKTGSLGSIDQRRPFEIRRTVGSGGLQDCNTAPNPEGDEGARRPAMRHPQRLCSAPRHQSCRRVAQVGSETPTDCCRTHSLPEFCCERHK